MSYHSATQTIHNPPRYLLIFQHFSPNRNFATLFCRQTRFLTISHHTAKQSTHSIKSLPNISNDISHTIHTFKPPQKNGEKRPKLKRTISPPHTIGYKRIPNRTYDTVKNRPIKPQMGLNEGY